MLSVPGHPRRERSGRRAAAHAIDISHRHLLSVARRSKPSQTLLRARSMILDRSAVAAFVEFPGHYRENSRPTVAGSWGSAHIQCYRRVLRDAKIPDG
jgi:hypothetical protein